MIQTTETLRASVEERDDEGRLVRPYFGEVEPIMTQLAQVDVSNGRQPELNDLYERAIWSHPAVREKVLMVRAEHDLVEKREKAKKARHAGS